MGSWKIFHRLITTYRGTAWTTMEPSQPWICWLCRRQAAKVANTMLVSSSSSRNATRTDQGPEREHTKVRSCIGRSDRPRLLGEWSSSSKASPSLSPPVGTGCPIRKPSEKRRHPSGTSAGHLSEYVERRNGSAASRHIITATT